MRLREPPQDFRREESVSRADFQAMPWPYAVEVLAEESEHFIVVRPEEIGEQQANDVVPHHAFLAVNRIVGLTRVAQQILARLTEADLLAQTFPTSPDV